MDLPFLHKKNSGDEFIEFYVSILVLMDLPFLLLLGYVYCMIDGVGFNPCSYGSSVLT